MRRSDGPGEEGLESSWRADGLEVKPGSMDGARVRRCNRLAAGDARGWKQQKGSSGINCKETRRREHHTRERVLVRDWIVRRQNVPGGDGKAVAATRVGDDEEWD